MNKQVLRPQYVAPIDLARKVDPHQHNLVMLQFDLWQLRQRIKLEEAIERAIDAYVARNGGRLL